MPLIGFDGSRRVRTSVMLGNNVHFPRQEECPCYRVTPWRKARGLIFSQGLKIDFTTLKSLHSFQLRRPGAKENGVRANPSCLVLQLAGEPQFTGFPNDVRESEREVASAPPLRKISFQVKANDNFGPCGEIGRSVDGRSVAPRRNEVRGKRILTEHRHC